jgi:hypothetical protein
VPPKKKKKERKMKRGEIREKMEDAILLLLKLEEEALSKGMQITYRS